MNKRLKKLLSFTMVISMMISGIGCSNEGGKKVEMGRYVEERYESPPKGEPISITKIDDGKIVMFAGTFEYEEKKITYSRLISDDGGQSWNETIFSLPKEEGMETGLGNAVVLNDGGVLISYCFIEPWVEPEANENGDIISNEDEEIAVEDYLKELEFKHGIINLDGSFEEVSMELEISEDDITFGSGLSKVAPNGDIFRHTLNGDAESLIQLDGTTFEIKNEYSVAEDIDNYFILGESLIVIGFSSIVEFDINTGEEKGNMENLEKEVLAETVKDYPTFIDTGSKTKLYYYNNLGLYEYDIETANSKLLIDAALSSFGNNQLYLKYLIEKDNNEFLAIFDEFYGYEMSYINYKYDANIPTVPDKNLTVYSFLEDDDIKEAISRYLKDNPDIYVSYEFGMDFEEGLTESDVVKKLNTEIAAGNGPDIIFLDGLPSESYIEKGLLEDISDVVLECVNKDLVFENIADAYTYNGKIYQIPTKIQFPVLLGNKKDIESVTDLDSLIKLVKKLAEENPDNKIFLDIYSPEQLIYSLYYLYGNDWLNSDNTINTEALTAFLENSYELYNVIKENSDRYYKKTQGIGGNSLEELNTSDSEEIDDLTEDIDLEDSSKDTDEEMMNIYEMNEYLMPPLTAFLLLDKKSENTPLMYGAINSTEEYNSIISALIKNKDLDYKVLATGEEKVFMPVDLVGINSKSENKEEAKEFIKGILSEDFTKLDSFQGLDINKERLNNQFAIRRQYMENFDEEAGHYISGISNWQDENGEYQQSYIYVANEDEVSRLINDIGNLTTAGTLNKVLLFEVAKQFEAYVSEKTTLEDAINAVVDNLDIYLSE